MTRHTGPTSKFGFCEDAGRAVSKITANGMANRAFLIDSPLVILFVEWARRQTQQATFNQSMELAASNSAFTILSFDPAFCTLGLGAGINVAALNLVIAPRSQS